MHLWPLTSGQCCLQKLNPGVDTKWTQHTKCVIRSTLKKRNLPAPGHQMCSGFTNVSPFLVPSVPHADVLGQPSQPQRSRSGKRWPSPGRNPTVPGLHQGESLHVLHLAPIICESQCGLWKKTRTIELLDKLNSYRFCQMMCVLLSQHHSMVLRLFLPKQCLSTKNCIHVHSIASAKSNMHKNRTTLQTVNQTMFPETSDHHVCVFTNTQKNKKSMVTCSKGS